VFYSKSMASIRHQRSPCSRFQAHSRAALILMGRYSLFSSSLLDVVSKPTALLSAHLASQPGRQQGREQQSAAVGQRQQFRSLLPNWLCCLLWGQQQGAGGPVGAASSCLVPAQHTHLWALSCRCRCRYCCCCFGAAAARRSFCSQQQAAVQHHHGSIHTGTARQDRCQQPRSSTPRQVRQEHCRTQPRRAVAVHQTARRQRNACHQQLVLLVNAPTECCQQHLGR
jgi:hypothetical protein